MNQSIMRSPLDLILNDILGCLNARLYYPGLVVALTVPDICSALALGKNEHVKQIHYVSFVDKYTKSDRLGVSGMKCYQLRGGVIHRGNAAGHQYIDATHVIFTIPEAKGFLHAFSVKSGEKTAFMLDLLLFCGEMMSAAKRWHEDHETDHKVIENMKNLLSLRPNGVSPFVSGLPVVASGQ